MALGFQPMARSRLFDRQATRQAIDRIEPAMHAAFYEELAPMRQLWGQRIQHLRDQFLFAEITQGHSIIPRQQPAQHTIAAGLLPGAFVIHATTAESVEHEIVAFDESAPERFLEKEADA